MELLIFVCIGLVITAILAAIAVIIGAWAKYKKTQEPPKE